MRHVANLPANRFYLCRAEHSNVSAGGLRQTGDGAQQRRLPCTVVTDNDIEFAGIKLRRHPTQRGESAKLLDKPFDADDRHGSGIEFGLGHRSFFIAPASLIGTSGTRALPVRWLS